jgi:hypothetical protein
LQVTKKRRIIIQDDDDDDASVTTVCAASADLASKSCMAAVDNVAVLAATASNVIDGPSSSKSSMAAVDNVAVLAASASNVIDGPSSREIWALRVLGLLKEDDTFNGPGSRRVWRSIQELVAAGAVTDIDTWMQVSASPAAGQQPLPRQNMEGTLEFQHRGLTVPNDTALFTYSCNFVDQVPFTCMSTMVYVCTWKHITQRTWILHS